jgi:hypothetical protein
MKVTWFDYAKDKQFVEVITEEQLAWLNSQSHIEVDKIEESEES